ncbi:DNA topoisomerase 3 [Helicobacter turcicus]|uniref:DNA topoisomerase n=1 Tax=Helicobacter turcicus TaxID=2867412 RepID=A0ABS7JPC5_9HELI|nr:DNA topoisomerase 3 [Helicobacter turcicus]MBX7491220.1 DNA topoisomerase 3 [Helicobacter turcicus]MBX7546141.1 DNA topoisomerase 3 [Helicobacter turcicus]
MRLFIAEKPELGRAIAEAMQGTQESKQGHIIKGDSIITWAFGHILKLAEPESYNQAYEKWNLNSLPLALPYPFKRIPIPNAKEQLKTITNLINKSEVKEIIHCGDADEEGQILIDEILEYSKTNKPILRCLINDITPKAIQKALTQMQPNSNFKGLSQSGFARSEADFIVGLNATRFYTLLNKRNGGQGVVSVGRVQTPILALIVNRELENKNHKSLEYFSINGEFCIKDSMIKAPLKQEEKITEELEATNIKNLCENNAAKLTISKENKKEYPPLPFNLLELQAECSKLFGYSPDSVLDITQTLREKHKAISYNRSDCQYLPENLYAESPQIIECLKTNFKEDIGQLNANTSIKGKAFDDSKLSAHYGIIPLQTKLNLEDLSENERKIYTLIAQRFLMQFYPPCLYESFKLRFKVKDYVFETTKRQDLDLGFKGTFENAESHRDTSALPKYDNNKVQYDNNNQSNEESLDFNTLLDSKEDKAICKAIILSKEKTKPRPLYTMTTLLKDLNQVSKYVKDERIKKLLLEKDKDKKGESGGIGTPATRSNHIKTLIEREYISVSKDKKQNIKVLQKGFKLIESLPQMLSGVDMTALWYEQQKEIQKGLLSKEEFIKGIHTFIADLINTNKESNMSFNQAEVKEQIKCPKCENGILREISGKYGKFFSCSNYQNGCDFKAKSINGKPDLEPKQESQTSEYQCPQCKKGFLIKKEGISKKTNKPYTWYGCSEFKNGCKFSCFEKEGKPNLEGNDG